MFLTLQLCAREVGVCELESVDRQVDFERKLMDRECWRWGADWFVGDEEMDWIREKEYRMYEIDCYEVGVENAA